MIGIPLTLAGALTYLLGVVFVLVAGLTVLVVLIQKPKGGGLAGAFGGAGGSQQSLLGAKSGDVMTWITVGFFIAFLLLAVSLVYSSRSDKNVQAAPVGQTVTPTDEGAAPDAPPPPTDPSATPDTE